MVDPPAVPSPLFLTVSLTEKLAPGATSMGELLTAVAMRSTPLGVAETGRESTLSSVPLTADTT